MSDAPERIRTYDDDVLYIRADLVGLPEDLVKRVVEYASDLNTPLWTLRDLLREILRWHEQQKGGKE
jgi:hypothetical protein